MTGWGKLGKTKVRSGWIPDGQMVEVDYGYRCVLCGDTGIDFDDNDEPRGYCDCATGEAMREAAEGRNQRIRYTTGLLTALTLGLLVTAASLPLSESLTGAERDRNAMFRDRRRRQRIKENRQLAADRAREEAAGRPEPECDDPFWNPGGAA